MSSIALIRENQRLKEEIERLKKEADQDKGDAIAAAVKPLHDKCKQNTKSIEQLARLNQKYKSVNKELEKKLKEAETRITNMVEFETYDKVLRKLNRVKEEKNEQILSNKGLSLKLRKMEAELVDLRRENAHIKNKIQEDMTEGLKNIDMKIENLVRGTKNEVNDVGVYYVITPDIDKYKDIIHKVSDVMKLINGINKNDKVDEALTHETSSGISASTRNGENMRTSVSEQKNIINELRSEVEKLNHKISFMEEAHKREMENVWKRYSLFEENVSELFEEISDPELKELIDNNNNNSNDKDDLYDI